MAALLPFCVLRLAKVGILYYNERIFQYLCGGSYGLSGIGGWRCGRQSGLGADPPESAADEAAVSCGLCGGQRRKRRRGGHHPQSGGQHSGCRCGHRHHGQPHLEQAGDRPLYGRLPLDHPSGQLCPSGSGAGLAGGADGGRRRGRHRPHWAVQYGLRPGKSLPDGGQNSQAAHREDHSGGNSRRSHLGEAGHGLHAGRAGQCRVGDSHPCPYGGRPGAAQGNGLRHRPWHDRPPGFRAGHPAGAVHRQIPG